MIRFGELVVLLGFGRCFSYDSFRQFAIRFYEPRGLADRRGEAGTHSFCKNHLFFPDSNALFHT
jgi:hypothetical protein